MEKFNEYSAAKTKACGDELAGFKAAGWVGMGGLRMNAPIKLSELEEKATAATAGPWSVGKHGAVFEKVEVEFDGSGRSTGVVSKGMIAAIPPHMDRNGSFIAAFNPKTAMRLCAALREAVGVLTDIPMHVPSRSALARIRQEVDFT